MLAGLIFGDIEYTIIWRINWRSYLPGSKLSIQRRTSIVNADNVNGSSYTTCRRSCRNQRISNEKEDIKDGNGQAEDRSSSNKTLQRNDSPKHHRNDQNLRDYQQQSHSLQRLLHFSGCNQQSLRRVNHSSADDHNSSSNTINNNNDNVDETGRAFMKVNLTIHIFSLWAV